MKKSTRQILIKVEITVAILALLVGFLTFFSRYGVTGFVSADSKTQQLNILIDKSQSFILTSGNEESYILTSFRVSGEIAGGGLAEIYLRDGTGQLVTVYNNIKKKTRAMSAITGMVVGGKGRQLYEKQELDKILLVIPDKELEEIPKRTLPEDEEIRTGLFSNACIDSCFIEMEMSRENKYQLIVKIEPGTTLKITRISYTTQEN